MFDNAALIHRYTRTQAIADGVLIDASDAAREAGFSYPVALTRAAWERYVRVPEGVIAQDESGRLWDVLWMLRVSVEASPDGDTIRYRVYVRNDDDDPKLVTLKAVCGPGDRGEPCITVMLPEED